MSSPALEIPNGFDDLIVYFESWAKPSFRDRYKQRMSSTQDELKAFYAALLPRMDAITECLNQFKPGQIPDAMLPLYFLACSFMDVAPAVEIYDQPDVPLGLEWWRPQMTESKTPLNVQ